MVNNAVNQINFIDILSVIERIIAASIFCFCELHTNRVVRVVKNVLCALYYQNVKKKKKIKVIGLKYV